MKTQPFPAESVNPTDKPRPVPELRLKPMAPLLLVELDPRDVVDGKMTPAGFSSIEEVPIAGPVRERCPYCAGGQPLQLVLRSAHVIRAHLFCEQCTRCFDAVSADLRSDFAVPAVAIY